MKEIIFQLNCIKEHLKHISKTTDKSVDFDIDVLEGCVSQLENVDKSKTNELDNEKEIVEKLIGIDIRAKTNKGDNRVISLTDFKNEENSSITFNSCDNAVPKRQIVITINYEGYSVSIK